jgi:DNA-binding NarL/FixJ family response regulator
MGKIRVLLVDDHEIFRRGLRALLDKEPQFEVCGEAVDGQKAIEEAVRLRPDIIVMDISMPKMNGLEATKVISKQLPGVQVIVMSQHDSAHMKTAAIVEGASAYVTKSQVGRDLIRALQSVAEQLAPTADGETQPKAANSVS